MKACTEWLNHWKLEEDEYEITSSVEPEPIANCLHSVKIQIESIIQRSGANDFKVFLSGSGNYREALATIRPYKGNRPDRKPYHYDNITDYLVNHYGAIIVEGQEADDAMSIDQWNQIMSNAAHEYMPETVICTIDKDLDCCPGWHYNFVKGIKYWVDEDTANEWFYCQLIMGDQTDNIQGIPGAGKKKAYEVLKECTTELERYKATLKLYCDRYSNGLEALVENARLLWMRRQPDEIWHPPIKEAMK